MRQNRDVTPVIRRPQQITKFDLTSSLCSRCLLFKSRALKPVIWSGKQFKSPPPPEIKVPDLEYTHNTVYYGEWSKNSNSGQTDPFSSWRNYSGDWMPRLKVRWIFTSENIDKRGSAVDGQGRVRKIQPTWVLSTPESRTWDININLSFQYSIQNRMSLISQPWRLAQFGGRSKRGENNAKINRIDSSILRSLSPHRSTGSCVFSDLTFSLSE